MHAWLFWLVTTFIAFASLPSMPSENENDRKADEKKAFTGMLARWTREISKSSQRRTKGVFHSRVYFRHEFSATWRRGAARVHLIHQPTQWSQDVSRKTAVYQKQVVVRFRNGRSWAKKIKKYCARSPPQRGIQAPWILFYYGSICLPFYYPLSVNFSSACCCRISCKNSPPTLPLWVDLFSPLTKQETKRRHFASYSIFTEARIVIASLSGRDDPNLRVAFQQRTALLDKGEQENGRVWREDARCRRPDDHGVDGRTRWRLSRETHRCVDFPTRSALSCRASGYTFTHITLFFFFFGGLFLGLRQTSWWQNVDFSL